jgi:hypothetical protein
VTLRKEDSAKNGARDIAAQDHLELLFGVQDHKLGRLLRSVVDEVKLYAGAQL